MPQLEKKPTHHKEDPVQPKKEKKEQKDLLRYMPSTYTSWKKSLAGEFIVK